MTERDLNGRREFPGRLRTLGATSWAATASPVAAAFLCLALAAPASATAQGAPGLVHVVIVTDQGEIEVAVDVGNAPITARNFLYYVDEGLYGGGTFYRVVRLDNQPDSDVKIEVIQGGMNRGKRDLARPPIRLEGTGETGLRHVDGVISMARAGPDTGRAEFFICVGEQPDLDEGGTQESRRVRVRGVRPGHAGHGRGPSRPVRFHRWTDTQHARSHS